MIWKKVNGEVFQKHKKFGLIRNFQNHQKGSSGPFFVDQRIMDVVWMLCWGTPFFVSIGLWRKELVSLVEDFFQTIFFFK